MKIQVLTALIVILLASCATDVPQQEVVTIPADQIAIDDTDSPFRGMGIRYDGYYKAEVPGVVYLIRFFPRGHAVLINGTPDIATQLPSYLTADSKGDPAMGWYNVPVTVREDSIFFKTFPEKGEISYRGNIPSTSMVRLHRHSHINGHQSIKEYTFQPDGGGSTQ